MKKRFIPFKVGEVLGGIEVLALLRDEFTASETVYHGRHQCCGVLVEIDHRALATRRRNYHIRCAECRKVRSPMVHTRRLPKREPAVQFIDEMPIGERPKPPSVDEILGLYARAERALRSKR